LFARPRKISRILWQPAEETAVSQSWDKSTKKNVNNDRHASPNIPWDDSNPSQHTENYSGVNESFHRQTTVALESVKGTEYVKAEIWTQTWTIKKVVSVCPKSQPLK